MTYNQLTTIDASGGTISFSDRGTYNFHLLLLDNPVIKIDFTGAASSYVVLTVTDSNSEVVAEWTIDDTLKVNYIEIGDVLRYAVQPIDPPATDGFVQQAVSLTFTFVGYDSSDVAQQTHTYSFTASRMSKYLSTGKTSQFYPTLPSRFRFLRSSTVYDHTKYNVFGFCARNTMTPSLTSAVLNEGSTQFDGTMLHIYKPVNYTMDAGVITSVDYFDSSNQLVERATVEVPSCEATALAIRWWSKVTGCWKAVVLDVINEGYTNDNTVDYWTDLTEDQLKGGTAYLTARFPNATWKDYVYYSDIIMGEHVTVCIPTLSSTYLLVTQYFQDVPVKVSGSWSFKQNDIKDMDFTITIKTYDIDD